MFGWEDWSVCDLAQSCARLLPITNVLSKKLPLQTCCKARHSSQNGGGSDGNAMKQVSLVFISLEAIHGMLAATWQSVLEYGKSRRRWKGYETEQGSGLGREVG